VTQERQLKGVPLYCQPWWLDAVAPGAWGSAEVVRDGQLMAWWPFVEKRFAGLRILGNAPLSQALGPWLAPLEGKQAKSLGRQKDLVMALADQLPSYDLFEQNLSYRFGNVHVLQWAGFSTCGVGLTYLLDLAQTEEAMMAATGSGLRTDIRKAAKTVCVRPGTIDELTRLSQLTFQRQNLPYPYDVQVIERAHEAASTRCQVMIRIAEDSNGKAHAGVLVLAYGGTSYYLLGGGDPALRNSGATSLCLWGAVQESRQHSDVFDFEGSMVESIERFFRSFGGKPTHFFKIAKAGSRLGGIVRRLRKP
jgi:hypothetical protein